MIILISKAIKTMEHKEKINALIIKLNSSIVTIKNVLKELSNKQNPLPSGRGMTNISILQKNKVFYK